MQNIDRVSGTADTAGEASGIVGAAPAPAGHPGPRPGESCGDFAVRISETWAHDARNPLTVIMGNADLLADADEVERRAMAGEIARQCRYLEILIREIPILISLTVGRYVSTPGRENLRAIIESSVRFIAPFMQEKKLTFRFAPDPGMELVHADSACLELAISILLFNLCRNARPSASLSMEGHTAAANGGLPALELSCDALDIPCHRPSPESGTASDAEACHERANTRVEIARRLLEATDWTLAHEPHGEQGCRFILRGRTI
jgi:hypothetical protein